MLYIYSNSFQRCSKVWRNGGGNRRANNIGAGERIKEIPSALHRLRITQNTLLRVPSLSLSFCRSTKTRKRSRTSACYSTRRSRIFPSPLRIIASQFTHTHTHSSSHYSRASAYTQRPPSRRGDWDFYFPNKLSLFLPQSLSLSLSLASERTGKASLAFDSVQRGGDRDYDYEARRRKCARPLGARAHKPRIYGFKPKGKAGGGRISNGFGAGRMAFASIISKVYERLVVALPPLFLSLVYAFLFRARFVFWKWTFRVAAVVRQRIRGGHSCLWDGFITARERATHFMFLRAQRALWKFSVLDAPRAWCARELNKFRLDRLVKNCLLATRLRMDFDKVTPQRILFPDVNRDEK